MLKQIAIVVVMLVASSERQFVCAERQCFFNDYCQYKLYSTKTMYDVVRGDIRDNNYEELQSCTPLAIWSINRHGTRRGGNSATEGMREVSAILPDVLAAHRAGRGRLCSQDLQHLAAWSWDPELDSTQSYLTESGYQELHDWGKRLKENFPELIDEYDPEKFYFRPTAEQRTNLSSIAFVEGLFGSDNSAHIDTARTPDEVIRPYEFCDKWRNEVRNNDSRYIETNKYMESEDYLKVVKLVQERSGIIDYELTAENITYIFELCRFEKSWAPKEISPWCAFFTTEDIIVLEYYDDLRHFYRNGYATDLAAQLGAQALKDMYNLFENVTVDGNPKVTAYFTHDTMIEMVFCAIGLFKDGQNLVADNRDPDRLWRTSFIGNFMVNLLATLYQCPSRDYRVAFHVNELPVDVPGCSAGSWCSWREFSAKFQQFQQSNLDFCFE